MPRYMIIRAFSVDESAMPSVGRRSRELVEETFPEITWEHSHVVVDETGNVKTFCIYTAPDLPTVQQHASLLGQHEIEGIHEIAGDVTPADFPPVPAGTG
jgi:Protein of unknown function (DUF4242)